MYYDKPLTQEELDNATPQELYDMGYSVHSTEITEAIKRMLKKNVWDQREKDSKKEQDSSKKSEENPNTEQKKDSPRNCRK